MHYTRIYSDEKGHTHFEEVKIDLEEKGPIGFLSSEYPVSSMQFRTVPADYNWDFHTAPAKQFIVLLKGGVEITTSLGDTRTFEEGEILLVEDVTGKGHKTKNLNQELRSSLFIKL